MKYNCLVVDDNDIERDLLKMYLERLEYLEIVGECDSAQKAIAAALEQQVDIIFSDVQMPGINGFELNRSFRTAPVFIFVSSYSEYAAESYNVDAIDFIVKPVTFERVHKATIKALEYLKLKKEFRPTNEPEQVAGANLNTLHEAAEDFFFFKDTNGFTRLRYHDILYIESMGDFSKVHTLQNTKHVILVGLKSFEHQLPAEYFKRVHKQYMVNVLHIAAVNLTEIVLSNKLTIPLSANYKQDLLDKVVQKKLLSRK